SPFSFQDTAATETYTLSLHDALPIWSAFTALGATVTRFWQLLVCRSLVGVGEAGYGPAAQALIAEVYQGRRRAFAIGIYSVGMRSEEHTSELQSRGHLVCRLLLEKKK